MAKIKSGISPGFFYWEVIMGKGNVCVTGKYEGLYYISKDCTDVYYRSNDTTDDEFETCLLGDLNYEDLTGGEWLYDECGSGEELEDVLECFANIFTARFPSFKTPQKDKWINNSIRVILENELFYIGVEDNEWSTAVKLLQKDDPFDNHLEGLQKRHYKKYLDGMLETLLERLPNVWAYCGAWTSKSITKEDILVH